MNIGEQIRLFRKRKGLTQKELGEKIGKTAQVVSNWERCYTPTLNHDDLIAIARALEITVPDIIGKEEAIDYLLHSGQNRPFDLEELLKYNQLQYRGLMLNDDAKDDIRVVLEIIYQRSMKSKKHKS
ncbi:helix-turn-helix transcriptional regulator [Anaeroselena agilis]|uniref:Helix-turn-helix transcriptional regulator n=1 Tax=Anaeroselena agilis TaxID=3063788 RepID=A0ABU3P2I6_9FIRM|nr:helix-turn-helix transcriptional regulator [Selenomonadales bacterium 4137-cl]